MQAVMFLIKCLPLVIEIMRSLEQAFPQKGWGPFRFGLLRRIFSRVKDATADGKPLEATLVFEGIVADVVSEMNAHDGAWTAGPAITPPQPPSVEVPK